MYVYEYLLYIYLKMLLYYIYYFISTSFHIIKYAYILYMYLGKRKKRINNEFQLKYFSEMNKYNRKE